VADFATALALVLVIEGALYAAFPEAEYEGPPASIISLLLAGRMM